MKWIKAGEGYVPENPEHKQWRYAETKDPVLWKDIRKIAVSENNSDLVEWLDETESSKDQEISSLNEILKQKMELLVKANERIEELEKQLNK